MRFLQNSVLICGAILLWLDNISPGRYIYKGVAHSIGPDVVKIYESHPNGNEPVIPVIRTGDVDVDTGQRVVVYIRNDYRDDEIQFTPQRTLKLLGRLIVTYCLVSLTGIFIRRRASRNISSV